MVASRSAIPTLGALLAPHPLRTLALLGAAGALGLAARLAGLPLWAATALALAALAWPALRHWRAVGARWGRPWLVVSVLLALQGFHSVEHVAQWAEFHLLGWPPRQATGLLSGLNVEVVHFVWNWSVLLVAVYLLRAGLRSGPRNLWGALFLAWALAHTLEHTYLMYQYLATLRALAASGASLAFAEGLPGVLGRGGWLAAHQDTSAVAGLICRLAPANLVTPRLDIHFWWNVGETALLLAVALGACGIRPRPAEAAQRCTSGR